MTGGLGVARLTLCWASIPCTVAAAPFAASEEALNPLTTPLVFCAKIGVDAETISIIVSAMVAFRLLSCFIVFIVLLWINILYNTKFFVSTVLVSMIFSLQILFSVI